MLKKTNNNVEKRNAKLQKASRNEFKVTQVMKEKFCISNYITTSCNWYKIDFTPNLYDFRKWNKDNFANITENDLAIEAIIVKNIQVSLLQHDRNFNVGK